MAMHLTASIMALCTQTAQQLRGRARRLCMARTGRELGPGGQRQAARALGWNRGTSRRGMHALRRGCPGVAAFGMRGRKAAAVHLPPLLEDIRASGASPSQADPQCRSQRLYTRLSAPEVRRQVIAQQGYTDTALPTAETSRLKLHARGYPRTRLAKTPPPNRSPSPTPSSRR
jgi:hypothetical protein